MWMKGQDVFLHAVARMDRDLGAPAWALLIGKGEDMDNLKILARELGIADRTVVTGYLDSLADAFAASDALAFPSVRSEGTSRVLCDCLAAGRPIAASRVGCTDEIVRDGCDGILVPPGDYQALAAALSKLKADPESARAMAESARRRALEEFDRRVVAKRMVSIYREAAQERKEFAA